MNTYYIIEKRPKQKWMPLDGVAYTSFTKVMKNARQWAYWHSGPGSIAGVRLLKCEYDGMTVVAEWDKTGKRTIWPAA